MEAVADICTIDDFAMIYLRVARVVKADLVEGADKLIRLELDIGDGRNRQVFAGLKAYYKPEELVGKLIVMIANLAPRKIRGLVSAGMILTAESPDGKLTLLAPGGDVAPGSRIS